MAHKKTLPPTLSVLSVDPLRKVAGWLVGEYAIPSVLLSLVLYECV